MGQMIQRKKDQNYQKVIASFNGTVGRAVQETLKQIISYLMMRHKKTEIERYRKKHDCKLEYEQRENDFSKMWKTEDKY